MSENDKALTPIDKLRLFALDPETFHFDADDAEEVVARLDELEAQIAALDENPEPKLFTGFAYGSFDGRILEVDLRGEVPQVMLILSAGGREIKCSCPGLSADDIRAVLNRRVNVNGRAFYDGSSGLPAKIEVSHLPTIVETGDFTKWKGAFSNIEPSEWSGEDDDA